MSACWNWGYFLAPATVSKQTQIVLQQHGSGAEIKENFRLPLKLDDIHSRRGASLRQILECSWRVSAGQVVGKDAVSPADEILFLIPLLQR